jgi:replicative DNA helicase
MLINEDAVIFAAPKLDEDCFAEDFNRRVFSVIQQMYEQGERIDPILVRRKLKCRAAELHELMDGCPVPSNYPFYLKQVQGDAEARLTAQAFSDAASAASSGDGAVAWDIIEDIRDRLGATDEDATFDAAALMGKTLDVADAFAAGSRAVLGVPTGWPSIDRIIGGLIPGNLVIVAARPGKGKSALAANLLVNVARQGERAVLVSLEMTAAEIGMRLICREASLNWESLRDGKVMEAGTKMVDAAERLGGLPMTVIDQPRVTVGYLRSVVQSVRPGVLIVDYLQLMAGPSRQSREQEVAAISRGLKLLAKEHQVCVVALAQMNRGVEMRGEGASPQLMDLRDSGALEQDADIVAFLVPRNATPYMAELHVEVAKNRNGMAKSAILQWDKPHVDLTDTMREPASKVDPLSPIAAGQRQLAAVPSMH